MEKNKGRKKRKRREKDRGIYIRTDVFMSMIDIERISIR